MSRSEQADIYRALEERVRKLEIKLTSLAAYLNEQSIRQSRGVLSPELARLLCVLDEGNRAREYYLSRVPPLVHG